MMIMMMMVVVLRLKFDVDVDFHGKEPHLSKCRSGKEGTRAAA